MVKRISMLLIAVFLIAGITVFSADNPGPKNPGEQVSDFTLKNYDGTAYTLSDLKSSKAVVIIFISTRCPFVQPYTDRLKSLSQEFASQGITFLAVNSNSNENLQEVKEHALKNGYPFPVLKDDDNKVADMFGATRTPEVFVLDPNRTVLYHGRIDDSKEADQVTSNDLMNALNDLTAGKDIAVKSTKQFGCSIHRVR